MLERLRLIWVPYSRLGYKKVDVHLPTISRRVREQQRDLQHDDSSRKNDVLHRRERGKERSEVSLDLGTPHRRRLEEVPFDITGVRRVDGTIQAGDQ